MPRIPALLAIPTAILMLVCPATGAMAAVAQVSASLPIQVDGAFGEWSGTAATDPAGDAGSSGIDLTQLWIANDQTYLFVRFDTGIEIEPDEGQDLRVVLDTDDNVSTGLGVAGVGAELVWSLGQRNGALYLSGGAQSTSHAALGLVVAPTASGNEFELAIRRDATGAGSTPLFGGASVRVVIADFGSGGDAIGAGTLYTFDPAPQPVPSVALARDDPDHVRVATYNIENDGLFDTNGGRQAALGRIFGAVNADVWILNEVWSHDGPQVEAKLEQLLPAGPGAAWTAINPLEGVVVVSRFPVLESDVLPVASRDWVAVRVDPRPKLQSDLVVLGNHWKAFSGPSNDATRQDQADGLIRYLADMRTGTRLGVTPQTPIVAGGDWNLVGIRRPLDTVRTGDILDQGAWGPDAAPDWDGSEFDEVTARHPDERLVYSWRSDGSSFYPGRLDWMFHTGSVLAMGNHFVLDTRGMTPANLGAHGLLASDTGTASDHAPLVADFGAVGTAGVSGGRPLAMRLAPPAPNPFIASTRIAFALPRAAAVTLRIYDAGGRVVRTLAAERAFAAGAHALTWDGTDEGGRLAAPGLYFAGLDAGLDRAVRRVVYLR